MTQWKIVFVSGIILFSMGLPLLIVGYVSAGENAVPMLAPGAIMFGGGTFVAIVAAAMGMGFGKRATTSRRRTWPNKEEAAVSKNGGRLMMYHNPNSFELLCLIIISFYLHHCGRLTSMVGFQ